MFKAVLHRLVRFGLKQCLRSGSGRPGAVCSQLGRMLRGFAFSRSASMDARASRWDEGIESLSEVMSLSGGKIEEEGWGVMGADPSDSSC